LSHQPCGARCPRRVPRRVPSAFCRVQSVPVFTDHTSTQPRGRSHRRSP
jgi:hypothetical protein